jgi:hypothetical protein
VQDIYARDGAKQRTYHWVSSALPFVLLSVETVGRLKAPAMLLLGSLAPEMSAALERPGPPACTNALATDASNDVAGAATRSKNSTNNNTQGRAEEIIGAIDLQRETEEKALQPETELGPIALTRHKARLRNAKRSRIKNPKPTHRALRRPKSFQSRAGQGRPSRSGQRLALQFTRPTDTGTPGKTAQC